jgi:hypothetical protein
MSNMSKCCNCYSGNDVKKFYSKFIGSLECEADYYCNICYNKVKEDEDELIKLSISNGTNISTIIKKEYIVEYVNPTSSTNLFKPMNIHKIVSETVDGIKKDFVMIEFEEYNNYMLHIACSNKKIIDDETLNKKLEKQQKQEETELNRINDIKDKEIREKRKEEAYIASIEQEIKINKFHNDKVKKIKEELQQDYKEVFKQHKDAKIQKCDFCNKYLVYPIHYKDENNKTYQKEYTKDKKQCKSICCMDCFQEAEQKKEDRKIHNTEYCSICKSSYVAFSDTMIISHLNSTKHKKNKAALEGKRDLSLLSVKELTKICSKTLNENGTYRINNYTKTKKDELVKQMNVIYDLLVFD